jgi:hypothetical protein
VLIHGKVYEQPIFIVMNIGTTTLFDEALEVPSDYGIFYGVNMLTVTLDESFKFEEGGITIKELPPFTFAVGQLLQYEKQPFSLYPNPTRDGIVQIIGLLRWVFVVPVLASDFVNTNDPMIQASVITSFKVIHQFGGVILGEHIGQLFTIIWTAGTSFALLKLSIIPGWLGWFGLMASSIYLLAQAELLATVIPDFPVWDLAGFIGSTLWLIWLLLVGIFLIKTTSKRKLHNIDL